MSLAARLQSAVLLIAFTLLAGCATSNIKSNYRLSPESGSGLVIGSVTYSGVISEYKMLYRHIPSGKSGFFKAGQNLLPVPNTDFTDGTAGELFSAALPAGRYEFFGWGIGSGPANTRSVDTVSIEFEVKAGQPIYLGSFLFVQNRRMGLTVMGAAVYHSLKTERDLAVFKRKYPHLAQHDIETLTPQIAATTPLGTQSATQIHIPIMIMK